MVCGNIMPFGCRPYEHKVTALTEGTDSVNMTVTNDTNVSSLDYFELVLCVNPDNVVTGEPLPFNITINGTTIPVYNRYSLPVYSNRLRCRKKYIGAYVDETSPYVILWNTPTCSAFAK